jgi:hypothetical protein
MIESYCLEMITEFIAIKSKFIKASRREKASNLSFFLVAKTNKHHKSDSDENWCRSAKSLCNWTMYYLNDLAGQIVYDVSRETFIF